MKIFVRIVVSLALLFLGCWNKQDHDITRPEVPRYTLSGLTLDVVSGEPVPHTSVYIQGLTMLYDISFPSQTIESDSSGRYVVDPVYPGSYIVQIVEDGYMLHEHKLQIEHQDRELDLSVPQIQFAQSFPSRIDLSTVTTFIHFSAKKYPTFSIKSFTGLFPAELWNTETNLFKGYFFCQPKFKSNHWVNDSSIELEFVPDDFKQMEMGINYYYATKYPDSLVVFDIQGPNSPNIFSLNLEYAVKDIDYNIFDNQLYACSDSLIYQVNITQENATEIAPLPKNGINAMTWNDYILYLFNSKEDLLYQVNLQLEIEQIYAVVNKSGNYLIKDIYDMHFDAYDNLWVTTL